MKQVLGKALASLVLGTTMLAAQAQQAQAQPPSVQLELNTKPQGLASDGLVRSDSRMYVTDGAWQLGLEQNRTRSYQGGNDFALVQYTKKAESWSISPGVRFGRSEAGEITSFPYAIFGQQLGAGTLTLTGGAATDRMIVVRGRYNGSMLDAGSGVKIFSWSKGTKGLEGIVGLHTRSGSNGAWLARSASGPYAAVATADYRDAGMLAYAKQDTKAHTAYGVLQASFASEGKRMDREFGPKAGFDTARSISDQLLHPCAPSVPSYLVNGGEYAAEIGVKRSPKESYTQAQAGGLVRRIGKTALYLGAGSKHGAQKGWQPVAEAAYTLPVKGHKVSLELRASPHPTLSVRVMR